MLHDGSVAPHFFEPVKFAGFWKHNMYHYIYVIDQYPLLGLPAFMLIGKFAASNFHFMFHIIGNGF